MMLYALPYKKLRRLLNLIVGGNLLIVALSLGGVLFTPPASFHLSLILGVLALGGSLLTLYAARDLARGTQRRTLEIDPHLPATGQDRHQGKEQIRERAEGPQLELTRRAALMQVLPLPVFYKDLNGLYLEANPAWESFFQISGASLGKQTAVELFPHAREIAEQQMQQERALLDSGAAQLRYELNLPTPDGENHKVVCHLAPFKDPEGHVGGIVGVLIDMSENLRTEATLAAANAELIAANQRIKQAQEQLVQSEKMACIGQLAAGVAHEINNPVGYVYSNLNALDHYMHDLFALLSTYEGAETGILDSNLRAMIEEEKRRGEINYLKEDLPNLLLESREGLERVKKIVQDLKDFSRKSSDDEAWQITDLHKCLDSTLNIVWNELKYKCALQRAYGNLPEIECLPSQLNQVIMNMLVNAGHAIEDKGTITVSTGLQEDWVWIAIQDTGKGIAPENLNRIFDPFFTTKPVGQGTGLGLALSYSIIQKHNGRIEVQSEVGVGTTFRIWLPRQHIEHAEAA